MITKCTVIYGEDAATPGTLETRVAQDPADWAIAHRMLDEEHLLGAGRPLLTESFSNPESHAGTVYRATNWTCAGDSKGFSQDHMP